MSATWNCPECNEPVMGSTCPLCVPVCHCGLVISDHHYETHTFTPMEKSDEN